VIDELKERLPRRMPDFSRMESRMESRMTLASFGNSVEEKIDNVLALLVKIAPDFETLSEYTFRKQKENERKLQDFGNDLNALEQTIEDFMDKLPGSVKNSSSATEVKTDAAEITKAFMSDAFTEHEESILEEIKKLIYAPKPKPKTNILSWLSIIIALAALLLSVKGLFL
jgi:hypothetical protein